MLDGDVDGDDGDGCKVFLEREAGRGTWVDDDSWSIEQTHYQGL